MQLLKTVVYNRKNVNKKKGWKTVAINRKLGRTTDQRLSILRTLTTDLIWHEKIETTEARAKEIKSIADSLI